MIKYYYKMQFLHMIFREATPPPSYHAGSGIPAGYAGLVFFLNYVKLTGTIQMKHHIFNIFFYFLLMMSFWKGYEQHLF